MLWLLFKICCLVIVIDIIVFWLMSLTILERGWYNDYTWKVKEKYKNIPILRRLTEYTNVDSPFWDIGCCAFCIGLVSLFVAFIMSSTMPQKFEYSHEFEIQALNDNHEMYINARVYSSDGNTESRYYFIREWNGGLKEGWVRASDSIIYETDDTPHIVCYKSVDNKDKAPIRYFLAHSDWLWENDANNEYHIYIPTNSIIDEYNINLQ